MKRVLIFLAAALLAFNFVNTASALDVEFGGQYRALGVIDNNPTYDNDADNDEAFFEQRFRVPVTFKVAEGITANLRLDFAEGDWGRQFNTSWDGWTVPNVDPDTGARNIMQTDRTYIQIDRGNLFVRVGQHWNSAGNYLIWNQQSTGVTASYDLNQFTLYANYSKVDENGTRVDDNALGLGKDTDFYGVDLTYNCDPFSIGLTFATEDFSQTDAKEIGYGLHANGQLGPFALTSSLAFFDGDDGGNTDYVGTEFFLDGSMPINDTITLGGILLYGVGTDDANEAQITGVRQGGGGLVFIDYSGAMQANEGYFGGSDGVFDIGGASGGVVGLAPYAVYSPTDALTVYAKLAYLEPEEDTTGNNLDSQLFAIGSIDYNVLPNTTLSAGMAYIAPDFDDGTSDDPNVHAQTQITLNW